MKELKRLSLKEEVDRDVARIEKEVAARKDLEDIKVSEDMETSLFNKIQEYEYEQKAKKVYRRKRKRYIVVALAAVLVLIFGSTITSVGSKSYWKVLWDRIVGDEKASIINVEKMDAQETKDINELQVYKEIGDRLGISIVRIGYRPKKMILKEFEVDQEQKRAVLIYEYNGQIIRYVMYMNDADSSFGQIETDTFIDEYKLKVSEDQINVEIKQYEVDGLEENRFIAEFEYRDAQYQIVGIMEKAEFEKIIENLTFFEYNA